MQHRQLNKQFETYLRKVFQTINIRDHCAISRNVPFSHEGYGIAHRKDGIMLESEKN